MTARRAAQKRGEGIAGEARQPARHLGRAEHGDPIAALADRQPPGRKLGCAFREALEEAAVLRRLRRRHHDLDHAQRAVGVALIVGLPEQFRRMTLLAGEEGDPGHGGIGGEGQ